MENDIKNRIQQYVAPDDIIAAMLCFFEEKEFPLDTSKIHKALFHVKEKYPELLNEFSFSVDDVYPYSRLLEMVLFRLQNADLINTLNPGFKVFIIPEKSKQFIQKNILPLFSKEQQEKLACMGKLFEKLLIS